MYRITSSGNQNWDSLAALSAIVSRTDTVACGPQKGLVGRKPAPHSALTAVLTPCATYATLTAVKRWGESCDLRLSQKHIEAFGETLAISLRFPRRRILMRAG